MKLKCEVYNYRVELIKKWHKYRRRIKFNLTSNKQGLSKTSKKRLKKKCNKLRASVHTLDWVLKLPKTDFSELDKEVKE